MSRTIKNANVAVVGGAGFLGSHLVDHLIDDRQCNVVVIDNLCAGRREFVHKRAEFIHADITKSEVFLLNVFKSRSIQYVLNYAAHPYIPMSFERPHHVFEVNANGAIQVINAAQEAGCVGILQVSSAEIYGDAVDVNRVTSVVDKYGHLMPDGFMINETAPVTPHSTYGVAKAAVDFYCQTGWRERKTPVMALRQFNCAGERETHPYVIPEIISQLSSKGPAYGGQVAHGDPIPSIKLGNNSFRDFQYAGDAVRMAVQLLERGAWGEVYNMGSESGIKIYDLAKLVGRVMGFADVQVVPDPSRVRPYEIWHLLSDNAKLRACGVEQLVTPLKETIRRTVAWYTGNGRKWAWER